MNYMTSSRTTNEAFQGRVLIAFPTLKRDLETLRCGCVLLHYIAAVVREAEPAMEQWLVADAKASGLGTGCAIQALAIWKMLSASEFARMADARAISWQTVEARIRVSPVNYRMRYESETGQLMTLHSTDALVLLAQAVLILQLPSCVQREDVADFIPTPGEWTHATPIVIVRPVILVTSSFQTTPY
jgi:hypothetical protein